MKWVDRIIAPKPSFFVDFSFYLNHLTQKKGQTMERIKCEGFFYISLTVQLYFLWLFLRKSNIVFKTNQPHLFFSHCGSDILSIQLTHCSSILSIQLTHCGSILSIQLTHCGLDHGKIRWVKVLDLNEILGSKIIVSH